MTDYSTVMPAEVRAYHAINEDRKKNKEEALSIIKTDPNNNNIFDKGNNKTVTPVIDNFFNKGKLNDTINRAIDADLGVLQDYKTVDDVINATHPELLNGKKDIATDKDKTATTDAAQPEPQPEAKPEAQPEAQPAPEDPISKINQIADAQIQYLEGRKSSGGDGRKDRCNDDINKLNSFKAKLAGADKNNPEVVKQLRDELLNMNFEQESLTNEAKQGLGTIQVEAQNPAPTPTPPEPAPPPPPTPASPEPPKEEKKDKDKDKDKDKQNIMAGGIMLVSKKDDND